MKENKIWAEEWCKLALITIQLMEQNNVDLMNVRIQEMDKMQVGTTGQVLWRYKISKASINQDYTLEQRDLSAVKKT